ncbi:hypothetical protein CN601_23780 [Bacillus sp. AFS017336]|nr:hypothetical protein CN601_23780 [Bacillus sp. AFS017336]
MLRLTLCAQEVASYLGVSIDSIYKLVREKKIPYIKVGKRILFRVSSIDEWICKQENQNHNYKE